MSQPPRRHPGPALHRRALLGALPAIVGGARLIARRPLPPPLAPGGALGLAHFMALSALLTGHPALDVRAGAAHLAALGARPEGMDALRALYLRLGLGTRRPPHDLDQLDDETLFGDPALAALADEIVARWDGEAG